MSRWGGRQARQDAFRRRGVWGGGGLRRAWQRHAQHGELGGLWKEHRAVCDAAVKREQKRQEAGGAGATASLGVGRGCGRARPALKELRTTIQQRKAGSTGWGEEDSRCRVQGG